MHESREDLVFSVPDLIPSLYVVMILLVQIARNRSWKGKRKKAGKAKEIKQTKKQIFKKTPWPRPRPHPYSLSPRFTIIMTAQILREVRDKKLGKTGTVSTLRVKVTLSSVLLLRLRYRHWKFRAL